MSLLSTAIVMLRKEARTFKYQVKEDGVAKNISALTAKMHVKADIDDVAYQIEVTGSFTTDGTDGKFEIAVLSTTVAAGSDKTPFEGVYELTLETGAGARTPLTVPRGAPFRLVENVYD